MVLHWDAKHAAGLKGVELCAYASRLIGSDGRLVLWGGGNSSIKTWEKDHTGKLNRVLWVKASGFDMKHLTREGFASLRLDELAALKSRAEMSDEEMTAYQMRCLLDPKASKPSIETLLHAFVPAEHVYHTHADAVAGFTCAPGSRERTQDAFGDGVLWVPYIRPGFELSRLVADAVAAHPQAWGLILDKHGALSWGDQAREAYERMLRLAESALRYQRRKTRRKARVAVAVPASSQRRAAAARVLPWLRGAAGRLKRVVVRWTDAPEALRFLARPDAAALSQKGPFSPDHTLQIKARPLFWKLGGRASLVAAMERYRRWYEGYFEAYAPPGTPKLDPYPRVVLIPGVGLFTTGKDSRAAGIAQELYFHTMEVMARVAGFSRYTPLDLRRLGGIEFWPLETYKYHLAPPEKEFSRRVVLVTGAAGAIGAATAERFCEAGASVVLTDIDQKTIKKKEEELNKKYGEGCAFAVGMDVTSERSVKAAFEAAVLRYGGLDVLFSNAGVASGAAIDELELADWERHFRVNATGHFLCAREALSLFKAQGLGGAVVFNASKNVPAPGAGFGAYSASKAAETQLARVLALEGGPHGVRVNTLNPDAVFEGSGLWSPQLRRARAKAQGIPVEKLEEFYASRNCLKARVMASDVAEAALFLASDRSAKTTGAVLPVDGGLREAFPR